MTAPSLAPFLLDFARALHFLLVYLGNPVVFILYLVACSLLAGGDAAEGGEIIFGFKTFTDTDSPTAARMNFVLFVLFTLPPYALWYWAQVRLVVPLICYVLGSSRTLALDKFCLYHYTGCSCALAIPGLLNVLIWSTDGMEGDLMDFIVDPLLLIATILYVVMWFVAVSAALEEADDHSFSDEDCDNDSKGIACAGKA